jgi:uncharacterized membrane protein YdjX (TVP38/TMEM64 family)
MADAGIGEQIDQVVGFANDSGGLALVVFLGAWIVAKTFLLDFISIALALSSGVIFGGVVQGALLSSLGATLGSLVGFFLSRSLLQEKVQATLRTQPIARALAKVIPVLPAFDFSG